MKRFLANFLLVTRILSQNEPPTECPGNKFYFEVNQHNSVDR